MLIALRLVHLAALLAGIHGVVRAGAGAAPARDIRVEVDGIDRTLTDSAGRYTVADLAVGSHRLRFISSQFELREVTVLLADSADLALDIELTPRTVYLPPLAVVASNRVQAADDDARNSSSWPEAGRYRLTPGWQAEQQAGGVDINDAIARIPGVATHGDNATALSIHGGRGSENLTLLDGIPVYGAVHFAGVSSAVNPDAVAAIDLHTGVSSARFGDALSGVIELDTKDPALAGELTGYLSTADVRSVARVPLGTGGVMFGARSSFRNLMSDGVGLGAVNGFQDFIAAGSMSVAGGSMHVIGFESGNTLRWEPTIASQLRAAGALSPSVVNDAASWHSDAIGATWGRAMDANREWNATAWWSGNSAGISTLDSSRNEQLASAMGQLGLSAGWSDRFTSGTLTVGTELTRTATSYRTATVASTSAGAPTIDVAAAPFVGALYGEWAWHGSSLVDFRAGLRANSDFGGWASLDPRVVLNIHPERETRIELGFGRTHQSTQSMLNEGNPMSGLIGPTLPINAATAATPAAADQWIASVAHVVAPGVTLTLDGYVRSWQHVLMPEVSTTGFFVASSPAFGDGAARGAHAAISLVRDRLVAHASAGVSVSIERGGGGAYPSSFDQPWTFSGDVNYRLSGRTTLQAAWNAGAGQPTTAILPGVVWQPYQPATGVGEIEGSATNLAGAINALRLPGPLRLDIGARREWRVGGSGHGADIITSVRLENLFDRADAVAVVSGPANATQFLRGTPRGLVFEVGWAH